ncbi:MAG: undecaprenyl-phosphate glucose phosphotransferase [Candidatus Brocadia sp.]|jgi:Undecaprenyl-phosphate glucose phosphotransferase|uniref:Undecaprenyl-phosphate glucose phosphotransferase n=1 Tax=Candidatus Brocadia fulgida TaxID=380242 RepID=A0A0M2UWH1_9BACT|nr:MAG: undecaprenyl-phosphate glucose phosphotransferase [Candidatus Brocadia fulgida]MCC6325894.1 undecaprenyl-phosphate glucose phosphotransferase [Candidatus Brocadia sp.]MCE7911850.1 undecaprenyl-phosphate glucose phosphotransferase [Candidatus Brocadia sp. AMX3]OQZ00953.1 MAG: undecaprenyl-phosphate glucose phosphotransferase [Candidatus Brocadia sp. UTAMX2]MDG5997550.1 undecaprenyl-phosphate glucose phosphotransferase [Candidatus Brocadia sp.]
MLKKHSKFFESVLLLTDWLVLSGAWMLAYYLRFYSGIVPVLKGIPPFKTYLTLLIFMIPLWGIVFRIFGLYRPRRVSTKLSEVADIAKASTFATLILISLTFLFRQYDFSRLTFFYFWLINILSLSLTRILFREFLRFLRQKGYNQRYALILGTENFGQDLVKKLRKHPELGIRISGFLTHDPSRIGNTLHGIRVLGKYSDVRSFVVKLGIDIVFVALPFHAHNQLKEILDYLGDEMVSIMVLPDLFEFITLRGSVSEFEGMPLISLRDTPLYGWNIIVKRLLDIVVATIMLICTAPLIGVISLLTKITSHGPVFFKQERMGMDGKIFKMIKFRTMEVDAEVASGPVWTKRDDPRCTKIGKLLRRTSLDELPQFFNVLRGDMSIVGPRPERPVFINNFRNAIPKYMLRHKMKAGITGWAQVSGWRGNTSLEKRIEYDLYYIENWSLHFDLKIIWLTLWNGFINKHAY